MLLLTDEHAAPLILVLGLVTVGLLGWTSNLGGKIMHQEVRE